MNSAPLFYAFISFVVAALSGVQGNAALCLVGFTGYAWFTLQAFGADVGLRTFAQDCWSGIEARAQARAAEHAQQMRINAARRSAAAAAKAATESPKP